MRSRGRVPLFHADNIDVLVPENFVLEKTLQPATADDGEWRKEFVLD